MEEDFEIEIRTLKNRPEKEIVNFLENAGRRYARKKDLIDKLRDFLKTNNVKVKEKPQRFMKALLLALILSDIGDQMSPFIRHKNIDKIKSICKKEDLNYNDLVDLTVCSDELIDILGLLRSGQKSN